MRRALAIDEESFGAEHPNVAIRPQQPGAVAPGHEPPGGGRAADAPGAGHRRGEPSERSTPTSPRDLNNLAQLLQATNRLAEAEPLMRRALAIDEASFGAEHPNVAIRLNNLAQLLQATNRLAEAEPLMRRALAIDEASFGAEHPNVATRPQQPGAVAPGHEPAGGGRAADAPGAGHRRGESSGRSTPTSPSTSTTWRSCSRPRTVWRRPSR